MFEALMLSYPNIDPVIFQIGPFALRWYSLSYIAGIVLGWWYIGWLDKKGTKAFFNNQQRDDLILWAIFGVILGGRLGYVIFYNAPYFMQNPAEILHIWQGGMSFHGGALGVIIAFYFYAKRQGMIWLSLMDRLAVATPIGLFLGRIANFINGELYGRTTDSWIGMVFPGGGPLPRHPSQLYEAALEGMVLFVILFVMAARKRAFNYSGMCSGMFLSGYGLSRFIVEFFREPDAHLGLLWFEMSMGQLLSVPMIIVGIYLMIRSKKQYVGEAL